MNYSDPVLRSRLASEYALGTLQGGARRRFEQLLAHDPALRGEVESWQARVYEMLDALPEQTPPTHTLAAIKRRIRDSDPQTSAKAAPSIGNSPLLSLWSRVGFWRGWSLAATLATLVLAVMLNQLPQSAPVSYVVVVTDDANAKASWVLSGHADSTQLVVRAFAEQPLPADRAFQLWVLPKGASTVRPVSLIPASGRASLAIDADIAALLRDAQKFGVSIEHPEGSPTGQPTTTPLYHGTPLVL